MGCGSSRVALEEPPNAPNQQAGPPQPRQVPDGAQPAAAPRRTSPVRQASHTRPAIPHSSTQRSSFHGRFRGERSASLAEHVNQPLKAPTPWTSSKRTWTRAQLDRERYEFFETRVTGRAEIWDAMRQVAELLRMGDVQTAQGILDAVKVTLPTGRLQDGGYDEAGNLYKVPDPMLGDPTNIMPDMDIDGETFISATDVGSLKDPSHEVSAEILDEKDRAEKGKQAVEKDAVQVRCRLSDRGGPDVVVPLGKSQSVGALVRRVKEEVQISPVAKVKIAYLGRMLDERHSLLDQGWKEGHVLNTLIIGVFEASK